MTDCPRCGDTVLFDGYRDDTGAVYCSRHCYHQATKSDR